VDDYGYTSAKIVLLPLMKEDGVAGSADGVLREPQAPHALVADLLGLLASQVSDLRGGVEEDTRTINFFLPTCKCSVVSAQVLSGAYSGDTVGVPGEGCVAADESGLQEKLAKAMRMSDKRRTRELVKAHERERERTLMASIYESRGSGTASVLRKSPMDSNTKFTGGIENVPMIPVTLMMPPSETYSLAKEKEEERKRQEAAAWKRERQRGEQIQKELAEMSQSSALTSTNAATNSAMTSSSSLAYARRGLQPDRNKGERDTNKRLSEDKAWMREVSYFVGLQQDLKRVCNSRTASELDKKQAERKISRALLDASDTMIDLYVRCGVPLTSPEGSVTIMSEDMPSSSSSRTVRDEERAWDTEGSGTVMSEKMQSNVLKSLSLHTGDAGGDGSVRGQKKGDVRGVKLERVPSWITETEVESEGGGESDVAGDQEGVQSSLSKLRGVKLERVPSWITETEVESEGGGESDVAGDQEGVQNVLPKLERISSWITAAYILKRLLYSKFYIVDVRCH